MGTTTTIATVRSAHGGELVTHKMLAACSTMSAAAKDPDLVNKIALLQNFIFAVNCKYILSFINPWL